MHEWLSGGVSPCQGEGRGFESRLSLIEQIEHLCNVGVLFVLKCYHGLIRVACDIILFEKKSKVE